MINKTAISLISFKNFSFLFSKIKYMAILQKFSFCKYFTINTRLFSACRRKKIVFEVASYILFFIISIYFYSCSTNKEQDANGLLANILLSNSTNSQYSSLKSVVELEKIDTTSFKGKCIDTFIGITPYQFYVNNIAFLSGTLDTQIRRTATTTKLCIDLGFRDPGGYVVNGTGGTSFTIYECSSKNTSCNLSSLNSQLGSSNTNPKGPFGSYSFFE